MAPLESFLLILFSIFIGVLASMLGIGGGILVVPLLNLVYGLTSQISVGTSLFTTLFTAISSTISYRRQRRIDYRAGLIMVIGSIPGGMVGAYATNFISSVGLATIFGATLVLVSLRFLRGEKSSSNKRLSHGWRRRIVDSKGEVFEYTANVLPGVAAGFLAGLVSGFLGVGGGIVMVPVLRLVVGFPMHLAVAASLFIMVLTSLSGTIVHVKLGHVILEFALPLVVGVIVGAQIGSRAAKRLSAPWLQRLFGIALFLIGLRMILEWLL